MNSLSGTDKSESENYRRTTPQVEERPYKSKTRTFEAPPHPNAKIPQRRSDRRSEATDERPYKSGTRTFEAPRHVPTGLAITSVNTREKNPKSLLAKNPPMPLPKIKFHCTIKVHSKSKTGLERRNYVL